MQSLKPTNEHDGNFQTEFNAWLKLFAFSKNSELFVNKFDNEIALLGSTNPPPTTVTEDLVTRLQNELLSPEFQDNMKALEPSVTDPNLLKIWQDAFTYPDVLQNFLTNVLSIMDSSNGTMLLFTFLAILKGYLNGFSPRLGLAPLPSS